MIRSATAPGFLRRDARPPISPDPAPTPGAVAVSRRRRTVVPRATMRPAPAPPSRRDATRPGGAATSVPITDPYVRRFWTAVVGPGAVADLLRLAAAAQRGRSLLRPVHLDTLLRHGLVVCRGVTIMVGATVPTLSPGQIAGLPPQIRRHHENWMRSLR